MEAPVTTRARGEVEREHNRVSGDIPPHRVLTIVSDEAIEVTDSRTGLTTVQRVGTPQMKLSLHEAQEDIAAIRCLPSSVPRNGHMVNITLGGTLMSNTVTYATQSTRSTATETTTAPPTHTLYTPTTTFNKQQYKFDTDGQLTHELGDYADATTMASYPPLHTTSNDGSITFQEVGIEWLRADGTPLTQLENIKVGEDVTLEVADSLVLHEHTDGSKKLPATIDGLWLGHHPGGSILPPANAALTVHTNLSGNNDTVTALVMDTTADDTLVISTNGTGVGATFRVTFDALTPTKVSSVTLLEPGSGYTANEVLTFKMSQFGGTGEFKFKYPRRSLLATSGATSVGRYESTDVLYTATDITHNTTAGKDAEIRVYFGAATIGVDGSRSTTVEAVVTNAGTGYAVGDTLTIPASKLGPIPLATGAVDLILQIDKVTPLPTITNTAPIQIQQVPSAVPSTLALSYFRSVIVQLAEDEETTDTKKQDAMYSGVTPAHANVKVKYKASGVYVPVPSPSTALGPLVFNVRVATGVTTATITQCGYGSVLTAAQRADTIIELDNNFFNTATGSAPGTATKVTLKVTFQPDKAVGNPSTDGKTDQTNHTHCRVATTPLFLQDYTWNAFVQPSAVKAADYTTLQCLTAVKGGISGVSIDGVKLLVGDRVLVKEFPTSAASHSYMTIVNANGAVTGYQPAHFNGVYTVTHAGTATTGMLLRRDEHTDVLDFRNIVNIKEGTVHAGASFTNLRPVPMKEGNGYDASTKTFYNQYTRLLGDPRAGGRGRSVCIVHPVNTVANQTNMVEGTHVALYQTEAYARTQDTSGIVVPLLTIGADSAYSTATYPNGVIRDKLLQALSPHDQGRQTHMVLSCSTSTSAAVSAFADGVSTHRMHSLVMPSRASGLPMQAKHRIWGKDATGDDTAQLSLRSIAAGDTVRIYGGASKTQAIVAAHSRASGTGAFGNHTFFVNAITPLTTPRVATHPYAIQLAFYRRSSLI